jgi:hypothetical protein
MGTNGGTMPGCCAPLDNICVVASTAVLFNDEGETRDGKKEK